LLVSTWLNLASSRCCCAGMPWSGSCVSFRLLLLCWFISVTMITSLPVPVDRTTSRLPVHEWYLGPSTPLVVSSQRLELLQVDRARVLKGNVSVRAVAVPLVPTRRRLEAESNQIRPRASALLPSMAVGETTLRARKSDVIRRREQCLFDSHKSGRIAPGRGRVDSTRAAEAQKHTKGTHSGSKDGAQHTKPETAFATPAPVIDPVRRLGQPRGSPRRLDDGVVGAFGVVHGLHHALGASDHLVQLSPLLLDVLHQPPRDHDHQKHQRQRITPKANHNHTAQPPFVRYVTQTGKCTTQFNAAALHRRARRKKKQHRHTHTRRHG